MHVLVRIVPCYYVCTEHRTFRVRDYSIYDGHTALEQPHCIHKTEIPLFTESLGIEAECDCYQVKHD
jgi:hypothetical protein